MIKNLVFSIFFFRSYNYFLIFLPTLFFSKIVLIGGKLMGIGKFLLKVFLSTKIIIKGKENIIHNENFL